jgi:hypothetical protein
MRRRHQAHSFEMLILLLAFLAGVGFLTGAAGLPLSIAAISPYLAYTWGVFWLLAATLTGVGVLSGNARIETPGLVFFLACCLVQAFAIAVLFHLAGVFTVIITVYASFVIYERIRAIMKMSRARNRRGAC